MPNSLLVISRDRTFRSNVKRALTGLKGGWVAQEAADAAEAITFIVTDMPSAVLVDVQAMRDPAELAKWAAEEAPEIRVALAGPEGPGVNMPSPVTTQALKAWLED